jgi:hypothetical protein
VWTCTLIQSLSPVLLSIWDFLRHTNLFHEHLCGILKAIISLHCQILLDDRQRKICWDFKTCAKVTCCEVSSLFNIGVPLTKCNICFHKVDLPLNLDFSRQILKISYMTSRLNLKSWMMSCCLWILELNPVFSWLIHISIVLSTVDSLYKWNWLTPKVKLVISCLCHLRKCLRKCLDIYGTQSGYVIDNAQGWWHS